MKKQFLIAIIAVITLFSCSNETEIIKETPCEEINQQLDLQAKKTPVIYNGSFSLTQDTTFIRKTIIKGDLNLNGYKVNAATCLVVESRVNGPGEISGFGAVFSKLGYQNEVQFGERISIVDEECPDPYEPTLSIRQFELNCN